MQKQILETTRLILRETSPDDLDFVAAMLADPEVMRYYPKCSSVLYGSNLLRSLTSTVTVIVLRSRKTSMSTVLPMGVKLTSLTR